MSYVLNNFIWSFWSSLLLNALNDLKNHFVNFLSGVQSTKFYADLESIQKVVNNFPRKKFWSKK
jgi:hypothetical protein